MQEPPTTVLPKTMSAVLVHKFISDSDWERLPAENEDILTFAKIDIPKLQKDQILIKVRACSPSPGDLIMIRGNLIFVRPDSFPFIPGMDVVGEVVDNNGNDKYTIGDIVVAANGMSPQGGMAEYMAVSVNEAVHLPTKIRNSHIAEAAASSSAITAWNAVSQYVQKGSRVLILGGSGGVGSSAISLSKRHAGASFVATTSTQTDMCQKLGADAVVDYRKENWWEMDWNGQKFDVVIDTVGGGNFTDKANKVVKTRREGGWFVAVTCDDPKPDVTTVWKAIKFMASLPVRPLYTWWCASKVPGYVLLMPNDVAKGRKQVLDFMQDGSLTIPMHGKYPFTKEGVRQAFQTVASGHAHGKVVVTMY